MMPSTNPLPDVRAGLVPAIHVLFSSRKKDVDARHKAGHDGLNLMRLQSFRSAKAGAEEIRNEIVAAGNANIVRLQYRRIAAVRRRGNGGSGVIAWVTCESACRYPGW